MSPIFQVSPDEAESTAFKSDLPALKGHKTLKTQKK